MEQLLESEKLELQTKITTLIRFRLFQYLRGQGVKKHTGVEIAKRYGLQSNRQSELKNPLKYPEMVVSWPDIRTLVGKEFITVADIEKGITMTEMERRYVKEELAIHGSKVIHDAMVEAIRNGKTEEEIAAAIQMITR
jgi:hypothetical protein